MSNITLALQPRPRQKMATVARVVLQEDVALDFNQYLEFYNQLAGGSSVKSTELASMMVTEFLAKDKGFQAAKKQLIDAAAPPVRPAPSPSPPPAPSPPASPTVDLTQ